MFYSAAIIYLVVPLLVFGLSQYALRAYRKDLRQLPGPILARFSNLYRLWLVASGDAPAKYRQVHEEYGPIVRVGPNHVDISDSSMLPVIYGIGSKFTKTPFYSTMDVYYQGAAMPSMFSTTDPVFHKNFKVPVSQLFSMTNMKKFEPYADECTDIFMKAMRDLEGQAVDLGAWVQWYAFDVVASLTFQRRFGFMEERRDIHSMIDRLDKGLRYIGLVTQYPQAHAWLMGNRPLMGVLKKLIPNLPDPLGFLIQVGVMSWPRCLLLTQTQFTEDEIARYDLQEKQPGRTDMLAQIRAKEAKDGKLSHRDMVNHLSNNL